MHLDQVDFEPDVADRSVGARGQGAEQVRGSIRIYWNRAIDWLMRRSMAEYLTLLLQLLTIVIFFFTALINALLGPPVWGIWILVLLFPLVPLKLLALTLSFERRALHTLEGRWLFKWLIGGRIGNWLTAAHAWGDRVAYLVVQWILPLYAAFWLFVSLIQLEKALEGRLN